MNHVYWMGGSPCAGKTTIAQIIAQEYGWQIYHIDRHVESYLERADPEKHPFLSSYKQIGLKKFLPLNPEEQLERVKNMSAEQFQFILDDIAELESDTPILVEGANLRAEDVARTALDISHAVWLVPTEEFQLEVYPHRGTWVHDVLRFHFAEDERVDVFDRWMQRDSLMAIWTAEQAKLHHIQLIVVDGEKSLLENAELVLNCFKLIN